MKTMCAVLTGVAGLLAMATLSAASGAQCLGGPWKTGASATPAMSEPSSQGARLMRAAYPQGQNLGDLISPIVGMWHVKFVAETISPSNAVPFGPGTEFDAGYQQWHNDGTEMLNSGRAPATGSFCMGVWTQTGERKFRLNHIAISWAQGPAPDSQSGPTNSLIGPASIVEEVTVSPDGKSFSGTFTLTQYIESSASPGSTLSPAFSIMGPITGTRIEVNTPVSPVF